MTTPTASAPSAILGDRFAGKRYGVLGLARSGLATATALLAGGAYVTAWDRQDVARAALRDVAKGMADFKGEQAGARLSLADPLECDLTGYDGMVVSPGVPLNTHPIAGYCAGFAVPVIGDIELFAQAAKALPDAKIIAITGTNGKSTTTALIHHILVESGCDAVMGGNIGLPILAEPPLPAGGIYVLELSSYQIDLTASLAADVALLLNMAPDHLDRYDGDFSSYVASKARLFAMQRSDQLAAFGNGDAETLSVYAREAQRRGSDHAVLIAPEKYAAKQHEWPTLQGPHNLENAAAAITAVEHFGISEAQWQEHLKSFAGLPHRMECICEHNGVLYINDSKATNTASAAPALGAWPADPEPRVHWIVGGLPKEQGLGACADYLGNVAAAYTIGEAGPMFAEALAGQVPVHDCEVMGAAVQQAAQAAKPGDVVLLAPACASFDQYRDFEKRGDAFRDIVLALTGEKQVETKALAEASRIGRATGMSSAPDMARNIGGSA